MKITFKLFATLSDRLPTHVDGQPRRGNAVTLELAEGTTIAQLIERFALPDPLVKLVLVDGHYVPPEQRAARALRDGETLAIWPPVAGG